MVRELDLAHRPSAKRLGKRIIAQYPIRRPALLAPPRRPISRFIRSHRGGGWGHAHRARGCSAGCGRGRRAVAVNRLGDGSGDCLCIVYVIVFAAAGYDAAVGGRRQAGVVEGGGCGCGRRARVRRQHQLLEKHSRRRSQTGRIPALDALTTCLHPSALA